VLSFLVFVLFQGLTYWFYAVKITREFKQGIRLIKSPGA